MFDSRAFPTSWLQSRYDLIVGLGALCVLLQQITVDYQSQLSGLTIKGSLIHLHMALLFAVAMLARERRIFTLVMIITAAAWILPRFIRDGADDFLMLTWSVVIWALSWAWILWCAHLAGWPRASGDNHFTRRDLVPFAFYGLFLYPLGAALLSSSIVLLTSPAQALNSAFQAFFAKQFGVTVLVLPLVVAWGERGRQRWQKPLQSHDIGIFVLLLLGLALSLWATWRIRGGFGIQAGGFSSVVMDYRFALLAALLWCVLRLPTTVAMVFLSLTLFALVNASAGAASQSNTMLGFINMVHITLETSVLLMTMCYLWVLSRDRRELSRRLAAETLRDTVTGLPNLKALRRYANEQPLQRHELGYLLLDQTDTLLGSFGLEAQAAAMRTVAAQLKSLVRVYYVGAGHFVLLPHAKAGDDVWDRLVAQVEQTELRVGGQTVRLLPYLGVAALPDGATPVDTALLSASSLAYEARHFSEVRPRYSTQDDGLVREDRRQQLQDAAEALACLRNERVELYFQPIRHSNHTETARRSVTGEVLCRLRNEHGELLSPARFIPAIEQSGRGTELDLAVLRALFALLRRYPRALPHCRHVAVNLTGQSLASTSFQVELRTLLADSPLPLSALCFEITETAAISSTSAANQLLEDLRGKGCRIAIDDFGVGMQSFSRLKELPVDIIKIDGSFVRNVTQRGRDYALVQASVAVAKAFGTETVAEYVENEATANCLRGMGVDWLQGYLYSPPIPFAQVLAGASERSGMVASIH